VPKQDKPLKNFAALSGLGVQMLVIIGVSTFLGHKLDAFCSDSTTNYFTLGFALFGVILATVHVVRKILKRSNRP
tara:strand:+ start:10159 stop:10383 length:225 start_codon:yes stop_codon:yes gene_type:complete